MKKGGRRGGGGAEGGGGTRLVTGVFEGEKGFLGGKQKNGGAGEGTRLVTGSRVS
jgi:hypothetical protein